MKPEEILMTINTLLKVMESSKVSRELKKCSEKALLKYIEML